MTHLQSIWFDRRRQRCSIERGLMEDRWHCRRWLWRDLVDGQQDKRDGVKWRRILPQDGPTAPVSMRWSNGQSEGDANSYRRTKVTLIFFHLSPTTNRVSLSDTFLNPACLHPSCITDCDRHKPSSTPWARLVLAHNHLYNWCTSCINKPGILIQTLPAVCSPLPTTRTKKDSWFRPVMLNNRSLAGNKVF